MFSRSIVTFVLAIAFLSGCSESSSVKKADDDQQNSRASTLSKVNIDDVLARTDYPDAARKKFEQIKSRGRNEVLQREVSDIIRLSMIREPVTIEITSRMRYTESRQPSLSVLNDPPPSKYPRKPTNAFQLLEAEVDYARLGVEHFKKRGIFNLQDKDRQAVADYMNAVLDAPDGELNGGFWADLGKQGGDLAKRLTPQLRNEPMFNLCMAINESRVKHHSVATMGLDHAIKQFAATEYPTRMPIFAIRMLNQIRGGHQSQTTYQQRIGATKHWLTNDFRARGIEERFALEDVRIFLKLLRFNRDFPAIDEFVDYVESSETLPKWFQSMALAEHYTSLAYYYRGTGYANTVTKEGWEKFEKNSKIAHKYFEEALKINPNYPEAAAGLMEISKRGYSDKTEEYWFKKAIEHEVDYMPVYTKRLLALRPRWGGSTEEMIKFATEHANKKEYETGIPFILPQCIFVLRDEGVLELGESTKLEMEPKLLDDTITALKGLNEQNKPIIFNGTIQDDKFIPTLLALFLTRADRGDEAARVYRALDRQHSPFAVKMYGTGAAGSLDALSASAAAISSEYGIEAKQLQALLVDSVEQRIANLDKIEELVGDISLSDPSGGLYFSRSLKRVQQEKRFADGEVVKIGFDQEMNMWKMSDNRQLTYISESAATFDNRSGDGHNTIIYRPTFLGPRITEMTFTFPDDRVTNQLFTPGFVGAAYEQFNYSFGVAIDGSERSRTTGGTPAPDAVCTGRIVFGASTGKNVTHISFPYRNNKIKLRVYTDKQWFEVYADDQYVFSLRHNAYENLAEAFALHVTRAAAGTGQVQISDITVQKWSGGPPETRRSAKLVDHYQQKFDADPDDRWNQFWLAHALHNHGDLDGALKLYKTSVESGVNKQMAGFYIGDILDRQGKRKEAFDWYLESALGVSEGGPTKLMYAHNPHVSVNGPVNWSSFRVQWLYRTCDFSLDPLSKNQTQRWAKIPGQSGWLDRCLKNLTNRNDHEATFNHRLESLEANIEKTPRRYKELATEVKDAIEANKVYEVSQDDEPLYLKVKEATPFFRSLDKPR